MSTPALAFDHAAIPVRDADATLAFYSGTLGLSLIDVHEGDDWGGLPWLMMIFAARDGRQLAFIAFKGGKTAKSNLPADARHYAFSLATKAELKTWRKRLVAAGIGVSDEDHGDQQSIYFEDPNGVMLEITAPASVKRAKANPKAAQTVASWSKRHSGTVRSGK
jgi:catechol 2,3-dioxygenase-like lactoylglutathione lyase family enzyme